ncbi:MAG: GNAT family N-acetyltransferase [bacterium]|nr:GNAT family N-acetyltransferase [bacterium]
METQPSRLALQPPDLRFTIRPVQLADATLIQTVCWPDRPPAAVYQLITRAIQVGRQGRGLGVVVMDSREGPLRGYGQVMLWPRCAEISDLIVAEDFRGRGFGTAIIQYLTRAAQQMEAECVEIGVALSNPGALALYRRLGFVDSHTLMLNLGEGQEPVLFLRLGLENE